MDAQKGMEMTALNKQQKKVAKIRRQEKVHQMLELLPKGSKKIRGFQKKSEKLMSSLLLVTNKKVKKSAQSEAADD